MQFTSEITPEVFAQAVQKGCRLAQMLPDWAAMMLMRQKFLAAAVSMGKDRVGLSEEELRDVSEEGAATVKRAMMTFVQAGGKLADVNIGVAQFVHLVNITIPSVMKYAVSLQAAHCQKVNLPVSKVVQLMLAQHCANGLGCFY